MCPSKRRLRRWRKRVVHVSSVEQFLIDMFEAKEETVVVLIEAMKETVPVILK